MSTELDNEDCTIVRKPCGCVSMMVVTKWIEKESRKEIGELVAEGCGVEHMTAVEARKQQFGCTHESKQHDLHFEVAS
jgi:hypothetical protein